MLNRYTTGPRISIILHGGARQVNGYGKKFGKLREKGDKMGNAKAQWRRGRNGKKFVGYDWRLISVGRR